MRWLRCMVLMLVLTLLAVGPAMAQEDAADEREEPADTVVDERVRAWCVGHDHPPYEREYEEEAPSYFVMAMATDLAEGTQVEGYLWGPGDSPTVRTAVADGQGTTLVVFPIDALGDYEGVVFDPNYDTLLLAQHQVTAADAPCGTAQVLAEATGAGPGGDLTALPAATRTWWPWIVMVMIALAAGAWFARGPVRAVRGATPVAVRDDEDRGDAGASCEPLRLAFLAAWEEYQRLEAQLENTREEVQRLRAEREKRTFTRETLREADQALLEAMEARKQAGDDADRAWEAALEALWRYEDCIGVPRTELFRWTSWEEGWLPETARETPEPDEDDAAPPQEDETAPPAETDGVPPDAGTPPPPPSRSRTRRRRTRTIRAETTVITDFQVRVVAADGVDAAEEMAESMDNIVSWIDFLMGLPGKGRKARKRGRTLRDEGAGALMESELADALDEAIADALWGAAERITGQPLREAADAAGNLPLKPWEYPGRILQGTAYLAAGLSRFVGRYLHRTLGYKVEYRLERMPVEFICRETLDENDNVIEHEPSYNRQGMNREWQRWRLHDQVQRRYAGSAGLGIHPDMHPVEEVVERTVQLVINRQMNRSWSRFKRFMDDFLREHGGG